MDNIITNNRAPYNAVSATITLDQHQYNCYKDGWLKINSPDGDHLETLGHLIQNDNAETKAFNLKNQIHLLEYLFLNINENIELPVQAVFGLVEIFNQMRNFCEEHVK